MNTFFGKQLTMKSCEIFLFFLLFELQDISTNVEGCREPPKVTNAQVSHASLKASYTIGDRIDYICEFGYVSSQKIAYKCSEDNKWARHRKGECILKRCELPADIPNGQYTIVNGNNFVVGTTIKYTCKDGFQMMSRFDTRTCRQSGWDNQLPVCEETVCAADVPPGRHITVDGLPDEGYFMRHGNRLKFSCAEPEKILRGHKEIICQSNGEWDNPFPICEEPTCLLHKTEENIRVERIPNHEGSIKPGHRLTFSCLVKGMIIKGMNESTCQKNGEWSSPFPTCEEATCVANITNMIIEGNPDAEVPYKPGDRLKVSCVQGRGLILRGQDDITCQEDGEWSSPFPTCVVKTSCGPPPNLYRQNADTEMLDSRKTEYKSGARVKYVCISTYIMEGDPHLTCLQGIWRGNITCIKPCLASVEEMDRRNIELKYGGRDRMFCPHMDHITFVCQWGKYQKRNSVEFRQQCLYGKMTLPECA